MSHENLESSLKEKLLQWCIQIAGSRKISGACLFGARASGYGHEESDLYVLLVIKHYPSRLMLYPKLLEKINAFFLVIDSGLFEADVEQGIIGEFVAEKIMLPYLPLISPEYLLFQEVKLKKRVIWELMESLALRYPEMAYEFVIKPKYFLHEDMQRKARVFPLISYKFLNTLKTNLKKQNTEKMMKAFNIAIDELSKEGWITQDKGNVRINKSFIESANNRKVQFRALFRTAQRGLLTYLLRAFPGVISPTIEDQNLYLKTHKRTTEEKLVFQLDSSHKYLFIPTPYGLVPLSDRTSIENFVRKIVPAGETAKIELKPLGGVLNTVYLASFEKNGEKQEIVVKRFEDWFAFKWFPLVFWTLGTHSFAVLGQTRLEREYAINQLLRQHNFAVPEILHVSPEQRLIFKEYVAGDDMAKIVKRIIASKEKDEKGLALVKKAGEKVANVHSLGITLGDCKPENIIINQDDEPVFLDLEQATRNGNQPWDVAEFLYYSGHYVSPIAKSNKAESIAQAFIKGYLEGGGKRETVKKAWSAQYTKVFSVFAPPHVVLAISNICRRVDKKEGQ